MITTHVLDTSRGRPAANIAVRLEMRRGDQWELVGRGDTDADGRCRSLTPDGVQAGTYRLTFDTGSYFAETFFPETVIIFSVDDTQQRYHVPLLISPFGYSTYRGS